MCLRRTTDHEFLRLQLTDWLTDPETYPGLILDTGCLQLTRYIARATPVRYVILLEASIVDVDINTARYVCRWAWRPRLFINTQQYNDSVWWQISSQTNVTAAGARSLIYRYLRVVGAIIQRVKSPSVYLHFSHWTYCLVSMASCVYIYVIVMEL